MADDGPEEFEVLEVAFMVRELLTQWMVVTIAETDATIGFMSSIRIWYAPTCIFSPH